MINFIEKDHQIQNEQTVYWFDVDGTNWAIADQYGNLTLLDCDGCPVEPCNDHDRMLHQLMPHYLNEYNQY